MTDEELQAIRERWQSAPRLHVVEASSEHSDWREWPGEGPVEWDHMNDRYMAVDQHYTVSPSPHETGWENDSGCDGYGLPRRVAETLARAPDDIGALLAQVDRLRRSIEELRELREHERETIRQLRNGGTW